MTKQNLQNENRLSTLEANYVSIHEKLDSILIQTTKSNGRIGKLENWRSYMLGSVAVMGVIIPLFISNLVK